MHKSRRSALITAFAISIGATSAAAQDLASWDFQRMRDARECDTQSKNNFMRLMAYQAIENRKIDQMNIPPQQKRQLGYEVYRTVQEHNRSEEDMARQCKQYFEDKQR